MASLETNEKRKLVAMGAVAGAVATLAVIAGAQKVASLFCTLARARASPELSAAISEAKLSPEECSVRLSQLELAMEIKAKSTEPPPDTDMVKPLAEMTISRVDMFRYLEVAHHVVREQKKKKLRLEKSEPLFVGIAAMAGCGKSTFVVILRMLLEQVLKVGRVQEVALDDFLSSREERERLAIKTRWDVNSTNTDIGAAVLAKLRDQAPRVELPVFAKNLDDRSKDETKVIQGPIDVVLFEGWRIGVDHPNFFPLNDFVDTMVFLDSDYDAIVGFVKERKKREANSKLTSSTLREDTIHGGIDFVVENRYYANYLKYLKPLIPRSDVVLSKDAEHHITAISLTPGRWEKEKEQQRVTRVANLYVGASETKPAPHDSEPLPGLYLAPNQRVVVSCGWDRKIILDVQALNFETQQMEHVRWLETESLRYRRE